MITRTPLRILSFTLPLLVVTFAALLAATALFDSVGDASAAQTLRSCAVATGLGLLVNVVLLVGTLGLRAVAEDEQDAARRAVQRRRRRNRGA